jgi:hypothetical protein
VKESQKKRRKSSERLSLLVMAQRKINNIKESE